MKSYATLVGLLLISLSLHAQIFVNANAAGNNSGSSWGDAYTSLSAAIDAAPAGSQLWVVAGTYLPGTNPGATFNMDKNLEVYGGFIGTETMLTQRNDSINLTILSGDINSDDISGNFLLNKNDNSRHIMTMSTAINQATIIDGFTFQGGHADTTIMYPAAAGGAILGFGNPIIRNCTFTSNYAALAGGAILMEGTGAIGSQLEACLFIANRSNNRGGAVYLGSMSGSGTQVRTCHFQGNEAVSSGGGLRIYNASVTLFGCHFDQNQSSFTGAGLAIFQVEDDRSVFMQACTFDNNNSFLGGGAYFEADGAEDYALTVDSCQFYQNAALPLGTTSFPTSGGGFHIFIDATADQGSIAFNTCTFDGNSADRNAGGLLSFINGRACSFDVTNCLFLNNQIVQQTQSVGSGLSIVVLNEETKINIQQSTFQDNMGGMAGAMIIETADGGESDVLIKDCDFVGNETLEFGSALVLDAYEGALEAVYQIEHCLFENNRVTSQTEISGGALSMVSLNEGMKVVVTHSTFEGNQNLIGGAAIDVRPFPGTQIPSNMDITLANSLIAQHDSGLAAIQVMDLPVTLSNLTIADNDMPALYLVNNGSATLRNSILSSPAHDDIILDMGSTISSLGGNLISDNSADASLTAMDVSGVDPLFKGSGVHPYQLDFGSAAVDLGQFYQGFDPLSLDMAGNFRLQGSKPDAGAYESPFFTSIKDQLDESSTLRLYPNPVVNQTSLSLKNSWRGTLELKVFNANGQLVYQQQRLKQNAEMAWHLQLSQLSAGPYHLLLTDGQANITKAFIKVQN